MANQTQTAGTALPRIPVVLEGDVLYDQIMSEIEPDLMTKNYETLDAKYAGETPAQNADRKERYAKAFEEYKRRFDLYTAEWNQQLQLFQRGVLRSFEADDRTEEDAQMLHLESAFA